MNNGFTELSDIGSLDRFIAASDGSPVVIFKHSETCGISARAYVEMQKLATRNGKTAAEVRAPIPIGIIAVQAAREVSDEIEARTGVEHESPQALLMAGGKVVWSASHGGVNADGVEKALAATAKGGAGTQEV